MRLDLDQRVGDVWALLEKLATDGDRDGVPLADAEPAIDFYVQIHCQIRTDVSGAHRVRVLDTIDLQRELLDPPAGGCRCPGVDQLIDRRTKDAPRYL